MGTLGLRINDELENKFRDAVYRSKGMKKGNLTDALEEAIQAWIEEEAQKVAKRSKK